MTNPLAYVSAAVPDDCILKISPSSFPDFINAPHNWYRKEVLGENPFTHNTSTVIGTIVHYCAEKVAKNEEVNAEDINDYIDSLEIHEDYDPAVVREHYLSMAERVVNDYVLESTALEVETQHCAQIAEGYYAAGTLDRLEGTKEDCMIVDFKTYNSKQKPRSFATNYKYQLLVYAWVLRQKGYNPTRLRLVYVNRTIPGEISEKTGKQLKSYFPELTIFTETLTEDDFIFIEQVLKLCVDSHKATLKYPELTHVIWHDARLAYNDPA